ncbi:hypothetical protein DICPUDRAFT_83187 [Dictyostelium purpureum]|uniref:Uncharacterized protein n=1 Tax=Dictyostelium purpureum TaxID=5786 RepID=F0ZYT2_DICPU|nr:uncharacterized protein DICPUDRAFT_83187 [Dictyostelium purpureum]EGC30899.1 hypothetical protein DICPUDRAFT_83187 [Dictyostelium purpureum]|eukprot:XP_003292572.1 hypothetical protein DICPUDRAFT_83187 [Dictyostelium purpureum]
MESTLVKVGFAKSELEFKGLASHKEDDKERVIHFKKIEGDVPNILNKHLMAWSVSVNGNENYKDTLIYLCEDKANKGQYQFTIHKKEPENKFEVQPQGKSTVAE